MAYDGNKPADNEYISVGPAVIRENFRALKEDRIVNAQKVMNYDPGNASGNIPISNGTHCIDLNADKLDGLDAGNSDGNIPISNGSLCANLNADMLDNKHSSDFILESGGTMSGDLDMSNNKIVNINDGISATDAVNKRQLDSAIPAGLIMYSATSTVPAGFLKCNGAAISRTIYDNLFKALVTSQGFSAQTFTVTIATPAVFTKTGHGFLGGERIRLSTTGSLPTGLNNYTDYYVKYVNANTFKLSTTFNGTDINTSGTQSGTHTYLQNLYGLGDGSTTFNLPDLRGEFLRSWDDSRGVDLNRTIGTFQSHDTKLNIRGDGTVHGMSGSTYGHYDSSGYFKFQSLTYLSALSGTETRPRNVALLAVIKY